MNNVANKYNQPSSVIFSSFDLLFSHRKTLKKIWSASSHTLHPGTNTPLLQFSKFSWFNGLTSRSTLLLNRLFLTFPFGLNRFSPYINFSYF